MYYDMFLRHYILWALPSAVVALAVLLCLLPVRLRRMKRNGLKTTAFHEIGLAWLVVYIAVLLSVTLNLSRIWPPLFYGFPLPGVDWFGGNVNFMLFENIGSRSGIMMLIGNILLFVPLSLLAPLLWRRDSWRFAVLLGGALSLGIELIQLAIGRAFDIDDLLMNTLGALLGWMLHRLIRAHAPSFADRFRLRACESRNVSALVRQ
jgi:glycopeptide antibiotics resistance protein